MAVFRIERTRDYTVMSNHHLRNGKLSLKAKGLLSMMLSLPEDWNYTTRGLAAICKEGVDAIGGALRELETAGYIVRYQLRDRQGRISDTEYVIYEQPQPKNPDTPQPDTASPDTENPDMVKPDTEKPTELNIEKSNTEKTITYGSSTDSIPFREPAAAQLPERKGRDAMSVSEMESYRDLILENIEYDHLCREFTTYREDLDEIVELMVETVCAKRKTTRIAGSDFPHEVVRSRFLKLDCSHIEFVMECLRNNTTEIRNMKQYLLAVLFNAPTTISNHYTAQVNHDMYAGGCLPAACVHIVVDLCGVVVADRGRRIKQHRKQILLHVADFGGIVPQAFHDKLDVGAIQLQKTGADHLMGEVAASDPGGFPLGADGLHHQLHNLVQVLPVGGKLPAQVVILDVLQNQIPITFHL